MDRVTNFLSYLAANESIFSNFRTKEITFYDINYDGDTTPQERYYKSIIANTTIESAASYIVRIFSDDTEYTDGQVSFFPENYQKYKNRVFYILKISAKDDRRRPDDDILGSSIKNIECIQMVRGIDALAKIASIKIVIKESVSKERKNVLNIARKIINKVCPAKKEIDYGIALYTLSREEEFINGHDDSVMIGAIYLYDEDRIDNDPTYKPDENAAYNAVNGMIQEIIKAFSRTPYAKKYRLEDDWDKWEGYLYLTLIQ